MFSLLSEVIGHKIYSILVSVVFLTVVSSCFFLGTEDRGGVHFESSCAIVITLTNGMIPQAEIVLLTILVAGLYFLGFHLASLKNKIYNLQFTRGISIYHSISPQEYSYLRRLFSDGIIHSKLYDVYFHKTV